MGPTGKKFWGPATWRVIHDVSTRLRYDGFLGFLRKLTHILPCAECRLHLKNNLAVLVRHLGAERDSFVAGYMLHSIVTAAIATANQTTAVIAPSRPEVERSLQNKAETLAAYIDALAAMAWTYQPSQAAEDAYWSVYLEGMASGLTGTNIPTLEIPYLKSSAILVNWTFILSMAHNHLPPEVKTLADYKKYMASRMDEPCKECSLD